MQKGSGGEKNAQQFFKRHVKNNGRALRGRGCILAAAFINAAPEGGELKEKKK